MERVDVAQFSQLHEEPRGYSTKYWIYDEFERLVKYNGPGYFDGDVMESLAANILNCLHIDTVNVHLGYNSNKEELLARKIDNPNCCIIDSFLIDPADVAIDLFGYRIAKVNTGNMYKDISCCFQKMFYVFRQLMNISEQSVQSMCDNYVRMILGDCIIDNEDHRIKNIEAIYNEREFAYRLAPSFDNALAFNACNIGADEGYCYIGNQAFPAKDIINYIVKNHFSIVKDIIDNLDYLVNGQLYNVLENYNDELSEEKIRFIYDYLNDINMFIKELEKSVKTK